MNERAKITASHLARQAIVYLRQSSTAQVEHNRKSTDRQYALAAKARELGWPDDRITVIDEDLGLSGSGFVARSGFARLTAEVALSHVGLVLGLEVSRLARNNADWHRLIDLGGLTDTLIGDADGIYHPALFNDRLLLGLKGTMSEAELHVLRARLNGGIRNKAARARSWSRAAASIASTLEASRSTKPSRGLSLRPLNRQSSAPLLPLLNGSKLIARPRSSNGVSASSGQATKLAVRSDAIVPSIQITGWSPVASSANGKRA